MLGLEAHRAFIARSSRVRSNPHWSVVVEDLEARGLVKRHPGREDRRTKLVTLTPAGKEAAERAEAILTTPPPPLASLSPAELETLRSLLVRCLAEDAPCPAQSRVGPRAPV